MDPDSKTTDKISHHDVSRYPLPRLTRSTLADTKSTYLKYPPCSGTGDIATDYLQCSLEYGTFPRYLQTLSTVPTTSSGTSQQAEVECGRELEEFTRPLPLSVLRALRSVEASGSPLYDRTQRDDVYVNQQADFDRWSTSVRRAKRYISPFTIYPGAVDYLSEQSATPSGPTAETPRFPDILLSDGVLRGVESARSLTTGLYKDARVLLDWIYQEETRRCDERDTDMMSKARATQGLWKSHWNM